MFRTVAQSSRILLVQRAPLSLQPCRRISKTKTNYFTFRKVEYELEEFTPMSWCLLLVPIVSFGLGCWQIQRKQWKEGLLSQLEKETTREPVGLPENLEDLELMEYRPVKVRGRFLHDKELIMGPRSFIHKKIQPRGGGIITQQDASTGFLVITPLQLEDRKEIILINRGWVPRRLLNPGTRSEGQVNGSVEIVGLVRKTEGRPQFSPKCKGEMFLYRDLDRMCDRTGAVPVYLDATRDSTIPGGPIGGQTNVTLRNEHLSYIITWFGLSFASSYFCMKKMVRPV